MRLALNSGFNGSGGYDGGVAQYMRQVSAEARAQKTHEIIVIHNHCIREKCLSNVLERVKLQACKNFFENIRDKSLSAKMIETFRDMIKAKPGWPLAKVMQESGISFEEWAGKKIDGQIIDISLVRPVEP